MLRQKMLRLFVRLVILTTLVSALFLTSSDVTRNTAHANDLSCPTCEYWYAECVASCPGPGESGHFGCIGSCNLASRDCEIEFCL
jgi:hypothetical protein